jgi:hypothetical protein
VVQGIIGGGLHGSCIWKLRGIRKGLEIRRCPLCNGEEDAIHILLKCPQTRRLREHLLSRK